MWINPRTRPLLTSYRFRPRKPRGRDRLLLSDLYEQGSPTRQREAQRTKIKRSRWRPEDAGEGQKRFDAERTAFLERAGWRVLRISNDEVYAASDALYALLDNALT